MACYRVNFTFLQMISIIVRLRTGTMFLCMHVISFMLRLFNDALSANINVWYSDNTIDAYSGSVLFEFVLDHQLS
jgi:hypothetical protein